MGDSRFSRYCKSNPRKMVKMWAEKEMRNLARLHAAGIRCPKPLQLRMHVLGEWVGGGGWGEGRRGGAPSAVADQRCCQLLPELPYCRVDSRAPVPRRALLALSNQIPDCPSDEPRP